MKHTNHCLGTSQINYRMERGTSKSKVKRHVGKYELGRTIGEGTFAKVRFAKNIETGEPVAIKILDKEKVLKHKLVEQVSYKSIHSLSFKILLIYRFHTQADRFSLFLS